MRNTTPVFEGTLPRTFFDPKPVKPAPTGEILDWKTVILTTVIATAIVSTVAIVRLEPASRPAPAPIAVVQATPTPTLAPVVRAELLPVEVRRATPVEGAQYRIQMPAGEIVTTTFRGSVPSFDQLPRQPNLFDSYLVTSTKHSWVFMQPVGFSAPAWVDP